MVDFDVRLGPSLGWVPFSIDLPSVSTLIASG
jgi:hypothetical protein